MIKIIEKGVLNTYKVRCSHCNSTLEFNNMDEESEHLRDVPRYGQCTNWFIICPTCRKKVVTELLTDIGYFDFRLEEKKIMSKEKSDLSEICNGDDDDLTNPCWDCSYFLFPIGCMIDQEELENSQIES